MSRKGLFLLTWSLALAILLVSTGQLLADEILLENGDRLTGTVVKVEGGKLTLKTEYAGEIQIPVEKIKKLVTENPAEVHLSSGEVIKGKLKTVEEGTLAVETSPDRETTTINWKKVAAINPPPKIPPQWKGNVNIGASSQTGNTDRKSASVGAEAARKTDDDRFSLRFLYNYAEDKGDLSARNTYGALKYDYFFTQKFYGYLGVELLNDKFQDLNLRATAGPGVGYQVWDDSVKSLQFEAGVSYVWEDHIDTKDKNWAAARLGADFRYQIFKFLSFTDRLLVYPNLEHGGEYTLRNEAALISPLGSGWALRLANIWERNSDPAPGIKIDDFTWILGLQYSF